MFVIAINDSLLVFIFHFFHLYHFTETGNSTDKKGVQEGGEV